MFVSSQGVRRHIIQIWQLRVIIQQIIPLAKNKQGTLCQWISSITRRKQGCFILDSFYNNFAAAEVRNLTPIERGPCTKEQKHTKDHHDLRTQLHQNHTDLWPEMQIWQASWNIHAVRHTTNCYSLNEQLLDLFFSKRDERDLIFKWTSLSTI